MMVLNANNVAEDKLITSQDDLKAAAAVDVTAAKMMML